MGDNISFMGVRFPEGGVGVIAPYGQMSRPTWVSV